MNKRKICYYWKKINQDKLSLIIIAFLLTTICGSVFNSVIQYSIIKREAKIELIKKRIEESFKIQENLSTQINERYFLLLRYFWSVKEDTLNCKVIWQDYYKSVIKWNNELNKNHSNLLLFCGIDISQAFLDYDDDNKVEFPKSIHYKFRLIHNQILTLKRSIESGIKLPQEQYFSIGSKIEKLNLELDQFLIDLSKNIVENASNVNI